MTAVQPRLTGIGAERGLAGQRFRRAPATMCYLAAVWIAGLATGSIAHGPSRWLSANVGAGLPALGHGCWWTPLSAALWASGPGGYLAVTVLALLILAPAEDRLGITRTFTTLLISQAGGLLLATGLVKLAVLTRVPWLSGLAGETTVGAVPGMLGVGFALSCTLTPLWRRRLRLLLTVVIAIDVMYIGHLEQVAETCGAAVGLVTVALTYDHAWPWTGFRASKHEVRTLVGMLVAVPALGAIVAALVASAGGPMPAWPRVPLQAALALLLLLCAYGLRRGRREAWWLAVVINLAALGISALPARATILLPAVTLMVLVVSCRNFDQTADSRAVRKLMATLGAALGVSCGTFLLIGYLLREHFGRLLYAWVFLPFWIILLGALSAFFVHTRTTCDADAADRARAILRRGGSTLSYMSTWPGNAYWFSPDGRAAIAYRAIAGVAVTVGEPYGDPAAFGSAITEFARFCENRSLQPCLYSVTARTRAITQQLGWTSVHIAEDALLPLAGLQFAGKKWQGVRAAMNKAAREGITAEWWSYPEMSRELVGQINQISGGWIADKGLPEMNFMLGGLNELNDPNVRCLIAVGADARLHGITSWLPVYDGGQTVGWTLDLMRRNTAPGAVRGVMEFLIATAVQTFQEEGARFVSLSGAPLVRLDRGERACAVQRVLDILGNALEPAYGFQSLRQFKAKFQPDYQPLYLTYPDPAALGPITIALGHAYLSHLTSLQGLRLLIKAGWPHTHPRPSAAERQMAGPIPDEAKVTGRVTLQQASGAAGTVPGTELEAAGSRPA